MLDPQYIVGFVDGEGCFSISISRRRFRINEVRLIFEIELREDDEASLKQIQEILKCGYIYRLAYERYRKWQPHVKYKVSSFKDIKEKIIPFFTKYPLQAKKRKQFELFCSVAKMIENDEHTTLEGLKKIQVLRETFKQHKDSLDALDAHVQWGGQ